MFTLSPDQLSAMSRFFACSVIREMASKGRSPLLARLAKQSGLVDTLSQSQRVYNLFDKAFSLLKRDGSRHEYVYKAALTQNILLGRHSLQTASMLNEFRVGNCKADLAILNGMATVYEIKSDRDSLARLERQISAYANVFAKVYVIAAEDHIPGVVSCVPEHVGVLLLNSRQQISTLREAVGRPEHTSPEAIFDCVRTIEAGLILRSCGVSVPAVPNTQLSFVLRELFTRLTPHEAHEGMVRVLKVTRNLVPLSDLVERLPRSLQPVALTVTIRKRDHERLVAAVNTPPRDAMAWA